MNFKIFTLLVPSLNLQHDITSSKAFHFVWDSVGSPHFNPSINNFCNIIFTFAMTGFSNQRGSNSSATLANTIRFVMLSVTLTENCKLSLEVHHPN